MDCLSSFYVLVCRILDKKMASKDQLVNMLLDMGFGNNRAVRGLQATGFKVNQIEP